MPPILAAPGFDVFMENNRLRLLGLSRHLLAHGVLNALASSNIAMELGDIAGLVFGLDRNFCRLCTDWKQPVVGGTHSQ
jgi:hypothetical protein